MEGIAAPSCTLLDKIPLSRRIHEIMKDKGRHYSISAMASRVGVNRETLRKMLVGQREIYRYELEKICGDLKLPVARVLQEDTRNDGEHLIYLLDRQQDTAKAVDLSEKLLQNVCGLSERCVAYCRLARAHFFDHSYDKAYSYITEAHALAIEISKTYKDEGVLYDVLSIMVVVYTAKQEYATASLLLEQVEHLFKSDPNRLAALSYLHAKVKE
jgi:hypothetical protein